MIPMKMECLYIRDGKGGKWLEGLVVEARKQGSVWSRTERGLVPDERGPGYAVALLDVSETQTVGIPYRRFAVDSVVGPTRIVQSDESWWIPIGVIDPSFWEPRGNT